MSKQLMPEARIRIMHSGGGARLVEALCEAVGEDAHLIRGASVGTAPTALPNRLAAGEKADIIIFAEDALPGIRKYLCKDVPPRVLASSLIGIGTATRGIIAAPDGLDDLVALLRSVECFAFSSSISGQHLKRRMLELGFPVDVMAKGRESPNSPVGLMLVDGSAQIGFQQVSELLEISGVRVLGEVPEALQKRTDYLIAILDQAHHQGSVARLVDSLLRVRTPQLLQMIGLRLSEDA